MNYPKFERNSSQKYYHIHIIGDEILLNFGAKFQS